MLAKIGYVTAMPIHFQCRLFIFIIVIVQHVVATIPSISLSVIFAISSGKGCENDRIFLFRFPSGKKQKYSTASIWASKDIEQPSTLLTQMTSPKNC